MRPRRQRLRKKGRFGIDVLYVDTTWRSRRLSANCQLNVQSSTVDILTDFRKDATLGYAQDEACDEEAGHALYNSKQCSHDPEDDCECRQPEPWGRALEDDIAWQK